MSTLLTSVMNMKSPNIVIVGDYMLDESVFGDAERLSPDSPVPVLEVKKTESLAGGSGNVARCVSAMGGNVTCIGVIGNDTEGQTLKALLEKLRLIYSFESKVGSQCFQTTQLKLINLTHIVLA